jgi:RNA polymerase-binding transcription factor DksA
MAENNKQREAQRVQMIREEVRQLLLRQRDHAVRDIELFLGRRLSPETVRQIDVALDSGDYSVLDHEQTIDLGQLQRRYNAFKETRSALNRLEEGTFGLCESCGRRIDPRRLRVVPSARYCIECQREMEEMEKIQKSPEDWFAPPRTGTEG